MLFSAFKDDNCDTLDKKQRLHMQLSTYLKYYNYALSTLCMTFSLKSLQKFAI